MFWDYNCVMIYVPENIRVKLFPSITILLCEQITFIYRTHKTLYSCQHFKLFFTIDTAGGKLKRNLCIVLHKYIVLSKVKNVRFWKCIFFFSSSAPAVQNNPNFANEFSAIIVSLAILCRMCTSTYVMCTNFPEKQFLLHACAL